MLLTGDGSFQMNIQELATCAEHDIPVKVVIINNGYLGMVRQWQELFWDGRYSNVDMGSWPDWVKLAEAYGATGVRLTDKTTLVADLQGRARDARPGGRRRPRHARGEHVPDDPGRLGRAGDGGLTMGEPGTKEPLTLEELEATTAVRTGRKHILSILVENKPGVLTRIAGLFARRGFNIDTLAVGPTDDESLSRITLTLDGAMHPIDQVTKQLHKLVNVIKIRDLEPSETVARELALFKVTADGAGARRGHAARRDLPRQDHRRHAPLADRRGHGRVGEDRGVRAHGAPVRAGGDGAHRRDRDLPRPQRDLMRALAAGALLLMGFPAAAARRRLRRRHGARQRAPGRGPAHADRLPHGRRRHRPGEREGGDRLRGGHGDAQRRPRRRRHLRARGDRGAGVGGGVRQRSEITLAGQIVGPVASGSVRARVTFRRGNRVLERCNSGTREWNARAAGAVAAPAGAFYGLTNQSGRPFPFVLSVGGSRVRVAAFDYRMRCRRGDFEWENITPGGPIAADGTFSLDERFSRRWREGRERFRIRVEGQVTATGVSGHVGVSSVVRSPSGGRVIDRCATGRRTFSALP